MRGRAVRQGGEKGTTRSKAVRSETARFKGSEEGQ